MLIIAGSAVFYAWWRPAYVWLPFAMTFGAFAGAAWIDGARSSAFGDCGLRPRWSSASCRSSSSNMRSSCANDVLGLHGVIDTSQLRYPLPLGLSFITFTLSAYVIDVYRGKYPLEPSLKSCSAMCCSSRI